MTIDVPIYSVVCCIPFYTICRIKKLNVVIFFITYREDAKQHKDQHQVSLRLYASIQPLRSYFSTTPYNYSLIVTLLPVPYQKKEYQYCFFLYA